MNKPGFRIDREGFGSILNEEHLIFTEFVCGKKVSGRKGVIRSQKVVSP